MRAEEKKAAPAKGCQVFEGQSKVEGRVDKDEECGREVGGGRAQAQARLGIGQGEGKNGTGRKEAAVVRNHALGIFLEWHCRYW